MQPVRMATVIDGRLYDTNLATLLAHDGYWEGHNFERPGRTTYLYRSHEGQYFVEVRTAWHVEEDHLEPVSRTEAVRLYEDLPVQEVGFAEAFEGAIVATR